MTDLHRPRNPVRLITASSLFDGHDAAINIMRRLFQSQGCEVIHLGHNRSALEVVEAAVDEDAQGIAVSSYQGGHVEYFEYVVDLLRTHGADHIRVAGGGGGVIVPDEIARLKRAGVTIFSPEDGRRMGLARMVNSVVAACDVDLWQTTPVEPEDVLSGRRSAVARAITGAELGRLDDEWLSTIRAAAHGRPVPVLGITGTGGAGKSSLTDELVRRLRIDQDDAHRVAVVSVDPTQRRTGGALLGDRIRMNSLDGDHVFFRSLATRGARELPDHLSTVIDILRAARFDLIVIETPGIGQGDAAIVPYADVSLYVMTPEFGAASQLEKIDMLHFADAVAVNKFDRRGAEDALRAVERQTARNRTAAGGTTGAAPVFGTRASRFGDDGVTALYQHLRDGLARCGLDVRPGRLAAVDVRRSSPGRGLIPPGRIHHLSQIAGTVREHHSETERLAERAQDLQRLTHVAAELARSGHDTTGVDELLGAARDRLPTEIRDRIAAWPDVVAAYSRDELAVCVRDRESRSPLTRTSLSGTRIPRVALPRHTDHGDLVRFWRRENLPGRFPFTAGVFPLKREEESPARMFAGEGDATRTNRRFRLLSEGSPATRLSTAFDSVTLYGRDPDRRPDIYGKIGTSGVSIATIDDMRTLYEGFRLTSPATSVSMTINGPAPAMLALFLNTVLDQEVDAFRADTGRDPDPAEHETLTADALGAVRGTVQADILKEDQGQNTCLFSTDFSLRMMADVQEWFIAHGVRNFYSVSISGYHIAEAGANPITQLAFTLANGFTYVEAYLARGMAVDDFAPNLSFFFSSGMDPEYSVLGRVARRVWAIAMRDRYGAGERSQKLKYHVQTSGRSLHDREMAFNDIRTTLQALTAVYDNANSLHTNAYDEAVTTPSEESVRRALAIQLVITEEWGLSMNENPLQGSYVVDQLTDLVEEAVLAEFDRLDERGGVLGAMETGYQRGRIQDESLLYEERKHDGTLAVIGVNTFRGTERPGADRPVTLSRASDEEKESQVTRVQNFRERHAQEATAALRRLRETAMSDGNVFAELMGAVRVCTLGQITDALFEVGGQYRRGM